MGEAGGIRPARCQRLRKTVREVKGKSAFYHCTTPLTAIQVKNPDNPGADVMTYLWDNYVQYVWCSSVAVPLY